MTALTRKPFQLYLRQDQLEKLRLLSGKKKTPIAELVRQSIDRWLTSQPVESDSLLDIIGLGDSKLGDLAQNHDQYLADLDMEAV